MKIKKLLAYEVNNSNADPIRYELKLSDPNILDVEIEDAIKRCSANELKRLLSEDFIYPFRDNPVDDEIYNPVEKRKYKGNHHEHVWGYKYFCTRPVIEALFIDHNHLFQKIVSLVVNAKEPRLLTALLDSFKVKDIEMNRFVLHSCVSRTQLTSTARDFLASYKTADRNKLFNGCKKINEEKECVNQVTFTNDLSYILQRTYADIKLENYSNPPALNDWRKREKFIPSQTNQAII